MPGPIERLRYLDGLRGVAALIISVMYHYVHFSGRFQPGSEEPAVAPLYDFPGFHALYQYGYVAVDVFFLMSGYVFSAVYAGDLAARRVTGREFFVRRFARLYPIHLLTLGLTAALVYVFFSIKGRFPVYAFNGLQEFTLNLLFMQSGTLERGVNFNGPSWSLTFEALAYLVFFVIAVRGIRWHWVWFAIAVGIILISFGVTRTWRPLLLGTDTGRVLVGFFLGLLIHRLGRAHPRQTIAAIATIGCLSALTMSMVAQDKLPVAITWIVCGLGLLALQHWPVLRRPLELRPLVLLGDLSLAIYLVHFPTQVAILILLARLDLSIPYASPLFLVGYGLTVVALAYILHYAFELPMQRFLRRGLLRQYGGSAAVGTVNAARSRS